jgi:AraC family transcriptional regulator, alkane utilization regulator
MEALAAFPTTDPVTELLRSVRVRSSMYCRSEMLAPWGFRVEARDTASFHLLTEGAAWLQVDGVGEPIRLAAGDLVILPTGRAHQLRDSLTSPAPLLDEILATHPVPNGRLRYGGSGRRAALLCGGFAIEGQRVHPVLAGLPPLLHVRGRGGVPAPWLEDTLRLITAEMGTSYPGAETVVMRLTDVLLIQAIRGWVAGNGQAATLRGLADARIGRAIRLVHAHPEQDWTHARLAAAAALSPSAFSARFRELTGESPMRYLARTRLARAADYLRAGDDSLLAIAGRTGYESDVSLSKAFKRHFGVPPGSYRKAG